MLLPFKNNTFVTIYADPAWPEVGGGRIKRGAARHYSLMTVETIQNMAEEVRRISQANSHCYLWTTNNFLPAALEVLAAWGYQYKTLITWAKDRFGLGQYYRGMTEHCLFGVRGNIPYQVRSDGVRAQGRTLLLAQRLKHSQKPEQMREWLMAVSPGPYLELFARHETPGWTTWGDQVTYQSKTLPLLLGV